MIRDQSISPPTAACDWLLQRPAVPAGTKRYNTNSRGKAASPQLFTFPGVTTE